MKKITNILIMALIAVMLFGTVYSSAAEPYDTYTYSIDGETIKSPPAYSAVDDFDAIDMNISKLSSVATLSANVSDMAAKQMSAIHTLDDAANQLTARAEELTTLLQQFKI